MSIVIEETRQGFDFKEPDGNVIEGADIESLMKIVEPRMEMYNNPKVSATMCVADVESINEAMDLTALAALCCWSRNLFVGDSIKLTITAEYCPESK